MFDPWVGKIHWGRAWQPTPVFLPGESHEQRGPVGYSPWGCKESDLTEQLTLFHRETRQNMGSQEGQFMPRVVCFIAMSGAGETKIKRDMGAALVEFIRP